MKSLLQYIVESSSNNKASLRQVLKRFLKDKVEDLSTLKLDANPTEFTLSDGTIFKLDSNGNKTKPAYNEKAKESRYLGTKCKKNVFLII